MNDSVLVLNASWEPLSVTRLSRAVALLASGDAVMHEVVRGKVLRHRSGSIPWPLTVRLVRYRQLSVSHKPARWSKQAVRMRDNDVCGYCGTTASTIDHVVPTVLGGESSWLNTVAACGRCNNDKGSRTVREMRWTLHTRLWHPTVAQLSALRYAAGGAEEWMSAI